MVHTEVADDYIIWVGRVSPSKGLHLAIELAKELNLHLKIIGPMQDNYPDFGDVSQYVEGIKEDIDKLDNVEYLGTLSHKETIRRIAKAKALIHPSDGTEACPMTVIEAMATGTPVITSKLGPMPELIKEGICGYMVKERNDVEGYISNFKRIDKISRTKLREYAKIHFSIEKMARKYEEAFNLIVERNKNAKN